VVERGVEHEAVIEFETPSANGRRWLGKVSVTHRYSTDYSIEAVFVVTLQENCFQPSNSYW
jgi:hypothetical protein